MDSNRETVLRLISSTTVPAEEMLHIFHGREVVHIVDMHP